MNKSELIAAIAANQVYPKRTRRALNAFVESVEEALTNGDRVQLVDSEHLRLGTGLQEGQNPQTGEEITISASDVPVFKAGKSLKDKVNRIAMQIHIPGGQTVKGLLKR